MCGHVFICRDFSSYFLSSGRFWTPAALRSLQKVTCGNVHRPASHRVFCSVGQQEMWDEKLEHSVTLSEAHQNHRFPLHSDVHTALVFMLLQQLFFFFYRGRCHVLIIAQFLWNSHWGTNKLINARDHVKELFFCSSREPGGRVPVCLVWDNKFIFTQQ